jgi:hypothetical protein
MSDDALPDVHRQALARLRVMGMNFAEHLHGQIDEPEADVGDLAVKFARVSRAVRQTIFLEARLADVERRRQEEAAAQARQPALRPPPWEQAGLSQDEWLRASRISARAGQAYDAIEKAIDSQRSLKTQDRLTVELAERMDAGLDDERFLSDAPIGEVIAHICRELGFRPDWEEFDTEDVDLEAADLARLRLGRYDPPPPDPITHDPEDDFYPPPPRGSAQSPPPLPG